MFEVLAIRMVRCIRRPAGLGVFQFGEFHQHVGHLVAALAAAHVHHDVGVAVLGHRLLGHGLARAEGTGNRRRAAHDQRKQHVQNPHAGEERQAGVFLEGHRTRRPHRPVVGQTQRGAVFEFGDGVVDGVVARRHDAPDAALLVGRRQDLVGKGELRHGAENGAAGDLVADLHAGREAPLLVAVETRLTSMPRAMKSPDCSRILSSGR